MLFDPWSVGASDDSEDIPKAVTGGVLEADTESSRQNFTNIVNLVEREADRLSKSTNRAKKDAEAKQLVIVLPDPPSSQASLRGIHVDFRNPGSDISNTNKRKLRFQIFLLRLEISKKT